MGLRGLFRWIIAIVALAGVSGCLSLSAVMPDRSSEAEQVQPVGEPVAEEHQGPELTLSDSVSFERLSPPAIQRSIEPTNEQRPKPITSAQLNALDVDSGAASLTLQPGDVINLTVFGRPELSSAAYVSDSGHIDVPLVGTVPVSGLSLGQASERVATAYREGEYLIDPQVNIALGAIRSQQFSIVGEVKNPGRFPLETRTSILDALALAGGISDTGARKAFVLRRKADNQFAADRFEVDLSDLLKVGSGRVVEIRAGDTIVVPKAPLFFIYGEVARPDAYPLRDKLTVIEAISLAGGLTARGSTGRIKVKRKNEFGEVRQVSIKIDDLVQPQDVINVRERIF